ncbi:hypothetical protein EVAR_93594_1 [Eumeta japonica]|uniref:Uncharacterized protein n=1 Tax=Eumeta variegata TaxID=151549 RepID=A0A4C1TQG5_EUMVA|nr:hypothetical protein EVAR_93594_1 [Eumeta japonica]
MLQKPILLCTATAPKLFNRRSLRLQRSKTNRTKNVVICPNAIARNACGQPRGAISETIIMALFRYEVKPRPLKVRNGKTATPGHARGRMHFQDSSSCEALDREGRPRTTGGIGHEKISYSLFCATPKAN